MHSEALVSSHVYYWNGPVWRKFARTPRGLYAITGTSESDAWIAGGYGDGWHFDGTSLNPISVGAGLLDVHDLWSLGEQEVWGAGYDHKVFQFALRLRNRQRRCLDRWARRHTLALERHSTVVAEQRYYARHP